MTTTDNCLVIGSESDTRSCGCRPVDSSYPLHRTTKIFIQTTRRVLLSEPQIVINAMQNGPFVSLIYFVRFIYDYCWRGLLAGSMRCALCIRSFSEHFYDVRHSLCQRHVGSMFVSHRHIHWYREKAFREYVCRQIRHKSFSVLWHRNASVRNETNIDILHLLQPIKYCSGCIGFDESSNRCCFCIQTNRKQWQLYSPSPAQQYIDFIQNFQAAVAENIQIFTAKRLAIHKQSSNRVRLHSVVS